MSNIKKYAFPLLLIIAILSDVMFSAILYIAGLSAESGMKQKFLLVIFILSIFVFIYDNVHAKYAYNTRRIIFADIIIIVLYWTTQFFYYTPGSYNYHTSLLHFGVICLPCTLLGMHLAKSNTLYLVDRILPFIILPTGLLMGIWGVQIALSGQMIYEKDTIGGLDYQNISYFMAELYAYCAYYVFFSSAKGSVAYRYMKWITLASMLFFAIACLSSGGRGAAIYLVVVSVFIIYYLFKNRIYSTTHLVFVLLAIIIVFTYVFISYDIANTAGMTRVLNHLTDDEIRDEIRELAWNSFMNSPIFGHGIGSIWWEVGYYSHNAIFDLLAETGIIGTTIVLSVYYKMYKRLTLLCSIDHSYYFIMFLFIKISLMTMFSGYWVMAYPLWFVFGLTMVYPNERFLIESVKQKDNRN